MQKEGGFFNIGGLSIEYQRVKGAEDSPTIVLLHEGLGCVSMWKDFPEVLCFMTGLSVFSYSRAGYGKSSRIVLPRLINFHTDEAINVLPKILRAAGIGCCVLIGHSDGASIGMIYVGANNTSHRVDGLILMAPHVLAERKCISAVELAIDAYENGKLRPALCKHHGKNVDCAFRGWAGVWTNPSFATWNIERYLPSITPPTLVIRGVNDPYNTSIHMERIEELVSGNVESFNLTDGGHAPHQEQAFRVTKLLADFITRVVM